MHKIFCHLRGLCFTVFMVVSLPLMAQQADINSIHDRLVEEMITATVDVAAVSEFVNNMKSDGSFPDVVYTDKSKTGWKPQAHLDRLVAMSVAYRKTGTSLYNSASLRDKIVLGLDYYFKTKPTSSNWYYNDIRGPILYGQCIVLLKGYVPSATLIKYSAYLRDLSTQYALDGDNMMNICNITIYKSDAENNFTMMNKAFTIITASLDVLPSVPAPKLGDVGIKADFSFHQHRQQLYIGGYGMGFMQSMMGYVELTSGTSFNKLFTPKKKQLYSDVMLKGVQSFGYRNVLDFGSLGRYISRPNGTLGIDATTLTKIKTIVDPSNAAVYDQWISHLTGGASATIGNRHFWKSDIMTQHGPNYYMSAKIISSRSLGTESINDENLKYFHLPLGATNIMTEGDEYLNIYPSWDWSRIPGTTAEMNPALAPLPLDSGMYLYGNNAFAGGVSNGTAGATAFQHDYYGVKANKAYFYMGDMMLCMGNSIKASKTNNVVTNLNQCFLSGDITTSTGAGKETLTGNAVYKDLTDVKWVHHDKVGYIFGGGSATVQAKAQTGSWRSINQTQSYKNVTNNVFSLWINHSPNPGARSYMYIVAPDKTAEEVEALSSNHGFVVVQNDATAQAVRNDKVNQYAIVFYSAGTVDLKNGLIVTSDKKALVLIEKKGSPTYKISVADPIASQSGVTLTLNKNVTGPNASYVNGKTSIGFTFPTGEYKGSDATDFYTIKEPTVAITSPAKGAVFYAPAAASITTSVAPADPNVPIAKVEFYNGSIKLGEDNTSPYAFNLINLSAAVYNLTAKITDAHGIYSTSPVVSFTVKALDPSLCQTVIASSNDGNEEANVLDNNLNTRWSADGDGQWIQFCLSSSQTVSGVQVAFYSGNSRKSIFDVQVSGDGLTWKTVMSKATSSGSSLQLQTFTFTPQSAKHVRLVGHGNSSNTWNSYAEVKIMTGVVPPNQSPVVSLTAPLNNANYTAPAAVTINATANDTDGSISKVEFYNGATYLGVDESSPYSFTWSNVPAGTYTVTAKATDNLGLTSTSLSATIKVNAVVVVNQAPTSILTAPAQNTSFNAPASVLINATANDLDGSIAKVEFYNGTQLLMTDPTAPYSYTWSNVAAGTYSLTAKAYDNAGATTVSSAVTVTVKAVVNNVCSGLADYKENDNYIAGSKVKAGSRYYECKPFPYSSWCNGAAWAYAPATGSYWTDAWYDRGSCTGRESQVDEVLTDHAEVMLSPNPASDFVTIRLNEASLVTVYNSQGVEVIAQTAVMANGQLSLIHLSAGMYWVKIETATAVRTRTIVKN